MKYFSRRAAMHSAIAGAVTLGTSNLCDASEHNQAKATELWTLEGALKVHPKFLYRYYLVLLDGQTCALYGANHQREHEILRSLVCPVQVQVRGTLGTEYHPGSTPKNASPFPKGWWMYMNVHEVEKLST